MPTQATRRIAPRRWFALVAIVVGGVVAAACGGGGPAGGGAPSGLSVPPGAEGGYDISWVQCGGPFPKNAAFGLVGVSSGLPFHDNPCLVAEYRWAAAAALFNVGWISPASEIGGFYFNSANPGNQSAHWSEPGPRRCSGAPDDLGCAYNYGYNAARHAFRYTAARTGAAAGTAWWLDIETGNTWSADVHSNRADIRGMLDYLNSQPGVTPGIYSTASQWAQITGGAALTSTPVWLPSTHERSQPSTFCASAHSFTGGPVALVQYPAGNFDGDYPC